jgi:ABC-type multidrug transport system fused ATPase/permease subunit
MKELRRFLGYLKGYGGQIALAVSLVLAVTVLTLPYPLIVRKMLDEALLRKDGRLLAVLMLVFLAFFLARGGLSYLNRYVLRRKTVSAMRMYYFNQADGAVH